MASENRRKRILVTAVNGDLGQAVLKALRLNPRRYVLYGSDATWPGVGEQFLTGEFHRVPMALDHPEVYLAEMERLTYAWGLDAVVPCSEQEIHVLGVLGDPPQLAGGIPVICQSPMFFDHWSDKLLAMIALQASPRDGSL